MIQLIQRFPNFFPGFTPQKYEFNSLDELNNFIDNPPEKSFLCNWNTTDDFVRFEIIKHKYTRRLLLMAILKESFWAIGWIKDFQ